MDGWIHIDIYERERTRIPQTNPNTKKQSRQDKTRKATSATYHTIPYLTSPYLTLSSSSLDNYKLPLFRVNSYPSYHDMT